MPDLQRQIADTIVLVRSELEAQCRRRGVPPPVLRPHPPADEGLIAELERHHQIRLPPSYRAFLSLHDGYDGLAYYGDLLSVRSALPGGSQYQEIVTWKKRCADYGSGEVLDGVVIGSSLQSNQWLFIDINRPAPRGEYIFVDWIGESSEEFASLIDYFDFVVTTCRIDLADSDNLRLAPAS